MFSIMYNKRRRKSGYFEMNRTTIPLATAQRSRDNTAAEQLGFSSRGGRYSRYFLGVSSVTPPLNTPKVLSAILQVVLANLGVWYTPYRASGNMPVPPPFICFTGQCCCIWYYNCHQRAFAYRHFLESGLGVRHGHGHYQLSCNG